MAATESAPKLSFSLLPDFIAFQTKYFFWICLGWTRVPVKGEFIARSTAIDIFYVSGAQWAMLGWCGSPPYKMFSDSSPPMAKPKCQCKPLICKDFLGEGIVFYSAIWYWTFSYFQWFQPHESPTQPAKNCPRVQPEQCWKEWNSHWRKYESSAGQMNWSISGPEINLPCILYQRPTGRVLNKWWLKNAALGFYLWKRKDDFGTCISFVCTKSRPR